MGLRHMQLQHTSREKYRRLIPYILVRWRSLALILLLTLLSAAMVALMPWPLKLLVDYAFAEPGAPELLRQVPLLATPESLVIAAAIASLALFAVSSALDVALTYLWSGSGQRMVYDLAGDLFRKLQRLSLLFHSKRTVGDSLSRLSGDTWCVFNVAQGVLIAPAQQLFTILTVGLVAWQLDPQLALLLLLAAPALALSGKYFGEKIRRNASRNRQAQSRIMAFVHQTLSAVPLVQAFDTTRYNRVHLSRLTDAAVIQSQRSVLFKNAFKSVNGLTLTIGAALVLYVGGSRVLSGALSVGSLLVFVAYMRSIQRASENLMSTYGNLKAVEASIDRVLEVLDSEEGVRERKDAEALPGCSPGQCGQVRFEGVSFGYEAGRPVLSGITLEGRPGETIALVGATGAGKSTLVSLIPRFFDPWEGRVLVDGRDVRDVQLASLRSRVALVLQEPFLLPLTVAQNIAYGRPEASREEVVAAARTANAEEFIERLPDGYETVLGERGATLSGGQRQRLAIARALLKDAPILILDEPTSALDAQTEALLLEALERLMARRTTFIIAHRLSTIQAADRIAVLEAGRLVETGTHQELVARGGVYAGLVSAGRKTLPATAFDNPGVSSGLQVPLAEQAGSL